MKIILFWAGEVIVGWLALRHLLSILTGYDQEGQVKTGQRLCHLTSFIILIGSCVSAIIYRIWWLLILGVMLEFLFRHYTIWTGKKYPLTKDEKEMSTNEFIRHVMNKKQ